MNCAIYKGHRKPDTYLFIEEKDSFERIPEALMTMMGELTLVIELELSPERKLAQADVEEGRRAVVDPADPKPGGKPSRRLRAHVFGALQKQDRLAGGGIDREVGHGLSLAPDRRFDSAGRHSDGGHRPDD